MATDITRGTPTTGRLQRERRLNDVGWGLLLMLTGAVWLLPTTLVPPGTWLFGVTVVVRAAWGKAHG